MILELVPDVLRQRPQIDQYEECCNIIFGIPVVGAERLPKLEGVISKILNKLSPAQNPEDELPYKLFIPKTPEGGSKVIYIYII